MSKKSRFRGSFDKEHGKWDQTLLISEPGHLYHNYWSLAIELKKVSLSDMQNLRTVCCDIECGGQVLSA